MLELLFKIMNSHALLECAAREELKKEAREDLTEEVCADLTNLFNNNYADRLLEDMLLFKTFC